MLRSIFYGFVKNLVFGHLHNLKTFPSAATLQFCLLCLCSVCWQTCCRKNEPSTQEQNIHKIHLRGPEFKSCPSLCRVQILPFPLQVYNKGMRTPWALPYFFGAPWGLESRLQWPSPSCMGKTGVERAHPDGFRDQANMAPWPRSHWIKSTHLMKAWVGVYFFSLSGPYILSGPSCTWSGFCSIRLGPGLPLWVTKAVGLLLHLSSKSQNSFVLMSTKKERCCYCIAFFKYIFIFLTMV